MARTIFDVTCVVQPSSVDRREQQKWLDSERQITQLCAQPQIEVFLTPTVTDGDSADDLLDIVPKWRGHCGTLTLSWTEACRRALLVLQMDKLAVRENGSVDMEKKQDGRKQIYEKMGLTCSKQLRNYLNLYEGFFQKYPVFLLQFRADSLPTSWNSRRMKR